MSFAFFAFAWLGFALLGWLGAGGREEARRPLLGLVNGEDSPHRTPPAFRRVSMRLRLPPPNHHLLTTATSNDQNTTLAHEQVTKLFKKGGVNCQASADTFCFTNSTSLALKCAAGTNAAPAPARAPLAGAALGALAAAAAAGLLL